MSNETQLPAKHVRPGAEVFLPHRVWRVVRAISAPDKTGMIWMTFDGGDRHGAHVDLVVPVRMDEALAASVRVPIALTAAEDAAPVDQAHMALAGRPTAGRPLEVGRRELFQAMLEAEFDLARAARHLDMDRRTLEAWIVAAGMDDFFCRMCFCDRLAYADRCDNCRAGWERFEVPPGVAAPPIVATHWSRRSDRPRSAPSRWEELKAVFRLDYSLDRVVRCLGVARQALEEWIATERLDDVAFCVICCRDKLNQDDRCDGERCDCGASNWTGLPSPTRSRPRPPSGEPVRDRPPLPALDEAPLDQRILDAVRRTELRSANAIVNEIGGRRQDVYATVKAMLRAGRLCLVDGVIVATE